jgi:hypothetical protein
VFAVLRSGLQAMSFVDWLCKKKGYEQEEIVVAASREAVTGVG